MSTPSRRTIPGSLRRLLIWVLLLTAWEAAFRVVGWRDYLFPAPSTILDASLNLLDVHTAFGEPLRAGWPRQADTPLFGPAPSQTPGDRAAPHGVLRRAWEFVSNAALIDGIVVSMVRLFIGFAISLALGAVLGLAMWRWKGLDDFLGPLFLGLQTLPSVAWVPAAILLKGFGLNDRGILLVMVMGSFFAIAIAMRDGLKNIPPLYRRAGLMLGASSWRLYRYVMLPATLPALASSLRQGFSFAWRSLMGAELVLVAVDNHGLGYLLYLGENNASIAQVVAVMIVMVLVGMAADRLAFAKLEKVIYRRFGLEQAR